MRGRDCYFYAGAKTCRCTKISIVRQLSHFTEKPDGNSAVYCDFLHQHSKLRADGLAT